MGKNISDDNRYEHGAVRSNAGMRIPVSGTEAAKQRSDAGTYTVCDTAYRMRFTVKDIGAIRNDLTASLSIEQFPP